MNGYTSPYQQEYGQIDRNRQLAQAILGQSLAPQQHQTGLTALARILAAKLSGDRISALDTQEQELTNRYQGEQQATFDAFSQALKGKPAVEPFTEQTPYPAIPQAAVPGDRNKAMSILLGSNNPQFQQVAMAEMLKAPTAPIKLGENDRLVDYQGNLIAGAPEGAAQPFEGTGMDAQSYNTIIAYNQKKAQGIPTTPQEDMAYSLTYQRVTQPKLVTMADGSTMQIPGADLSAFTQPGMQAAPETQPMGEAMGAPKQGVDAGRVVSTKPKAAVTEVDKQFAKEYTAWVASGGFADTQKQIAQISGVIQELESGEVATGGRAGTFTGILPDTISTAMYPKLVAAKQRVEEVVQRNLRLILGAQFTEKEGERLISRAFDVKLPTEENIRRLTALQQQMMAAAQAKQEAAAYYEQNGTLEGFTGKTYSAADFTPDALGWSVSGDDQGMDSGRWETVPQEQNVDNLLDKYAPRSQ